MTERQIRRESRIYVKTSLKSKLGEKLQTQHVWFLHLDWIFITFQITAKLQNPAETGNRMSVGYGTCLFTNYLNYQNSDIWQFDTLSVTYLVQRKHSGVQSSVSDATLFTIPHGDCAFFVLSDFYFSYLPSSPLSLWLGLFPFRSLCSIFYVLSLLCLVLLLVLLF